MGEHHITEILMGRFIDIQDHLMGTEAEAEEEELVEVISEEA